MRVSEGGRTHEAALRERETRREVSRYAAAVELGSVAVASLGGLTRWRRTSSCHTYIEPNHVLELSGELVWEFT